jgi:hypothetical protein
MDKLYFCIGIWKDVVEIIYYIALTGGVFIAWRNLRAMVKAQRTLRSPELYVYCPTGTDPINGLVIINKGNVIATNIIIKVSEKRKLSTLLKKLPKCSKKIPLLEKNDEITIFGSGISLNEFSNIKVKVKYNSPYHYKITLKYKNKFIR